MDNNDTTSSIPQTVQSDNIQNPQHIPTTPPVKSEEIGQAVTDDEAVAIAQAVASAPAVQGQIVTEKAIVGRPSKYNEGMLNLAKNYLAECKTLNKLPLLEELARLCDVHGETLENWSAENPEFFETIKRIKELQKERIILRGFGAKNPTFSIFMLKANHGMMESEKQILVQDRDVKVSITRE